MKSSIVKTFWHADRTDLAVLTKHWQHLRWTSIGNVHRQNELRWIRIRECKCTPDSVRIILNGVFTANHTLVYYPNNWTK